MDALSPPRIVCAANKYRTGHGVELIVAGSRHLDRTMRSVLELVMEDNNLTPEEQGFIDQHGRFYDRRKAYKIAAANGQIIRRRSGDAADGGTLYSENLY